MSLCRPNWFTWAAIWSVHILILTSFTLAKRLAKGLTFFRVTALGARSGCLLSALRLHHRLAKRLHGRIPLKPGSRQMPSLDVAVAFNLLGEPGNFQRHSVVSGVQACNNLVNATASL